MNIITPLIADKVCQWDDCIVFCCVRNMFTYYKANLYSIHLLEGKELYLKSTEEELKRGEK